MDYEKSLARKSSRVSGTAGGAFKARGKEQERLDACQAAPNDASIATTATHRMELPAFRHTEAFAAANAATAGLASKTPSYIGDNRPPVTTAGLQPGSVSVTVHRTPPLDDDDADVDNVATANVETANEGLNAVPIDDEVFHATPFLDDTKGGGAVEDDSCIPRSKRGRRRVAFALTAIVLIVAATTVLLGALLAGDKDDDTTSDFGCNGMVPGSMLIHSFASKDNKNSIVLMTVDEISEFSSIFLTTNAWNGSAFLNDGKGVVKKEFLKSVVSQKFIVYVDESGEWDYVDGTPLQLLTPGDNIMLYCMDDDNNTVGISNVIYGVNNWTSDVPNMDDHTSMVMSDAVSVWLRPEPKSKYFGSSNVSRDTLLRMWRNELWWGDEFDENDPPPGEDDGNQKNCYVPPYESAIDNGTCNGLKPGDLYITSFDIFSDQGGGNITFETYANISANATILMTDNAWTGRGFLDNEGEVGLVFAETVSMGSTFQYSTLSNEWTQHRNFNLTRDGDNIMVYCYEEKEDGTFQKKFLLTIMYGNATWSVESDCNDTNPSFDETQSARPYGAPYVALPQLNANSTGYMFPTEDAFAADLGPPLSRKYGMKDLWYYTT